MTLDLLKARLRDRLTEPAHWQPGQMALNSDLELNPGLAFGPRGLRQAAVLAPLVVRPTGVAVILTRRADTLTTHSGQIAFPGGRLDPGETAVEAALREAGEEISLDASKVEILGLGDPYETGTGFLITPVVGWIAEAHELVANAHEVADIFEAPWDFLMNAANHRRDYMDISDGERRWFWSMSWQDRYIWGVTAGIIRSLQNRLFPETDEAAA